MDTADGIASEVYPVSTLKLRNRTIAREDRPVRQRPAKKRKYGRNAPSIDPNVVTIIAVEMKDEPVNQQDCPNLDHIQPPPLLISKSNFTPAAGDASVVVLDQMQVTPAASAYGSGRTKRRRPPPRPKRENPRRQPQKLGRYVSGRGVKKIDWDKLLANYPNTESPASDSDTESQPSGGSKGFNDSEADEVQVLAVKSKPPPVPPPASTSFTFIRNQLAGFLEQAKNAVAPDPVPHFINPFMKVRPAPRAIAPPQPSPIRLWPRFNAPKSICEQVQSNLMGLSMKTSIPAMIPRSTQMQMPQCLSVGSQYDPEDIRRGEELQREAQVERQVLEDALDLQEELYERLGIGMEQPEDIEIDLGLVSELD